MAMTKDEASNILDTVINLFNMNMSDEQILAWGKILIEHGDYEKSMQKVEKRALSNNRFKPTLPEVIHKKEKELTLSDEELKDKEHIRRFEEDPEYREKILKSRREIEQQHQDLIARLKTEEEE